MKKNILRRFCEDIREIFLQIIFKLLKYFNLQLTFSSSSKPSILGLTCFM